ncbi:MAG: hypothetical protein H7125_13440 [Proteobacteria bacterium]|nr:hypothetical protein [Burkholderiales bacterium]
MKRFLKLMHEIGGIGMTGALAAHLILVITAPQTSLEEYAAVRQSILAVSKWLLLPSLLIVLASGLFAMAVHYPFCQARWVWAKALTGIGLFEGTLVTVQGTSRRAAELSALAVDGRGDAALLSELLRTEWIGLWTILTLALLNVVLAVLRPRLEWPKKRLAAERE